MKRTLKHVIAAIILALSFAEPAATGPLEDADAPVKKRDYATAVRLIRPVAEQGNANAQYNLGVFTTTVWVSRRTRSAHTCGSTCRRRKAEKVRQLFEILSHVA